jgi:hypothetical protein
LELELDSELLLSDLDSLLEPESPPESEPPLFGALFFA